MSGGRYRGTAFAQNSAMNWYERLLEQLQADFPAYDAQGIMNAFMNENAPGDSGVLGAGQNIMQAGQGLNTLGRDVVSMAAPVVNAATDVYGQTAPLQENILDQLLGFTQGGGTPDAYSPVMQAAKNQSERSYAQGLDELVANTGAGGARTSGMIDLLTNRANKMIDTRSGVAQDIYNKAYQTGANALPQYTSAIGQAGNIVNQGTNAMSQGANAMSQGGMLMNMDQANQQALYGTNANILGNALNMDVNQQQALLNTIAGSTSNAQNQAANTWNSAGQSEAAGKGGKAGGLGSLGGGIGSMIAMKMAPAAAAAS